MKESYDSAANIERRAKQVREVIRWVNSNRAGRELKAIRKLPKGRRERTDCCPVALALNKDSPEQIHIAAWGWRKEDSAFLHKVAAPVQDFIRRFDTGVAFQEYLDKDSQDLTGTQNGPATLEENPLKEAAE